MTFFPQESLDDVVYFLEETLEKVTAFCGVGNDAGTEEGTGVIKGKSLQGGRFLYERRDWDMRPLELLEGGWVGEGDTFHLRRWEERDGRLQFLGWQGVSAVLNQVGDFEYLGRENHGICADVRLRLAGVRTAGDERGTKPAVVSFVRLVNLKSSFDRRHQCLGRLQPVFPNDLEIKLTNGFDGQAFRGEDGGWNGKIRQLLLEAGLIGPNAAAGPVRTALALGHVRSLVDFIESGEPWGLFLEDDARASDWVYRRGSLELAWEVPSDAEVLWLHSRMHGHVHAPDSFWTIARRGIGTEAFAVSRTGARRMIRALMPLSWDCDLQWVGAFRGLEYEAWRNMVTTTMKAEGGTPPSPWLASYCHPSPPFREEGPGTGSVKFQLDA